MEDKISILQNLAEFKAIFAFLRFSKVILFLIMKDNKLSDIKTYFKQLFDAFAKLFSSSRAFRNPCKSFSYLSSALREFDLRLLG